MQIICIRKGSTSEDFTHAGRSLPGWVVGMSIFATYVSSIFRLFLSNRRVYSDNKII